MLEAAARPQARLDWLFHGGSPSFSVHLSVNTGLRFCTNADMPSFWSASAKHDLRFWRQRRGGREVRERGALDASRGRACSFRQARSSSAPAQRQRAANRPPTDKPHQNSRFSKRRPSLRPCSWATATHSFAFATTGALWAAILAAICR